MKQRVAESEAMRAEVYAAIPTLERLRSSSSIADRGLKLVLPLLEEEKRLREEAAKKKTTRKVSVNAAPAVETVC